MFAAVTKSNKKNANKIARPRILFVEVICDVLMLFVFVFLIVGWLLLFVVARIRVCMPQISKDQRM